MPLEFHTNDIARTARPGIWIFHGWRLGLIPVGVGLFILIFKILASLDVDWWLTLPIATSPMVGFSMFVWLFVLGKPESYATDLWLLGLWKLKSWAYMHECLDRPPLLWKQARKHVHPKEYDKCN